MRFSVCLTTTVCAPRSAQWYGAHFEKTSSVVVVLQFSRSFEVFFLFTFIFHLLLSTSSFPTCLLTFLSYACVLHWSVPFALVDDDYYGDDLQQVNRATIKVEHHPAVAFDANMDTDRHSFFLLLCFCSHYYRIRFPFLIVL